MRKKWTKNGDLFHLQLDDCAKDWRLKFPKKHLFLLIFQCFLSPKEFNQFTSTIQLISTAKHIQQAEVFWKDRFFGGSINQSFLAKENQSINNFWSKWVKHSMVIWNSPRQTKQINVDKTDQGRPKQTKADQGRPRQTKTHQGKVVPFADLSWPKLILADLSWT